MQDMPYSEMKEYAESLSRQNGKLISYIQYLETEGKKVMKARDYLMALVENSYSPEDPYDKEWVQKKCFLPKFQALGKMIPVIAFNEYGFQYEEDKQ